MRKNRIVQAGLAGILGALTVGQQGCGPMLSAAAAYSKNPRAAVAARALGSGLTQLEAAERGRSNVQQYNYGNGQQQFVQPQRAVEKSRPYWNGRPESYWENLSLQDMEGNKYMREESDDGTLMAYPEGIQWIEYNDVGDKFFSVPDKLVKAIYFLPGRPEGLFKARINPGIRIDTWDGKSFSLYYHRYKDIEMDSAIAARIVEDLRNEVIKENYLADR